MVNRESIYREVGRRLRAVREGIGLTQEDVASKLGMTLASYSRYETAQRRIPLTELERVAAFFGRPICYFLGEDVSPDQLVAWQYQSLQDEDRATIRTLIAFLQERRRSESPAA